MLSAPKPCPVNKTDIHSFITQLGPAEEMLSTNGGPIPYIKWLRYERDRMMRKGILSVTIWEDPATKHVCLARLRTE